MATKPTHALIFIHGLGDTSSGWSFLPRVLPSYPGRTLAFSFPTAPVQPVTCNGGMSMTSWFDIINIPVAPTEPDDPKGVDESVKFIHDLINKTMEKHSLPSSRIILGGFSQGGAMSLLAGSLFPTPLSGCVCLSGWLLRGEDNVAMWTGRNANVPLFIGHGTADQVVLPVLAETSSSLISDGRDDGSGKVTYKTYPGEGHGACDEELKDLAEWINEVTGE